MSIENADEWPDEPVPGVRDLRRPRLAAAEPAKPEDAPSSPETPPRHGGSDTTPEGHRAPPAGQRDSEKSAVQQLHEPSWSGTGHSAADLMASFGSQPVARKATRGMRSRLGMKAGKAETAETVANEAMAAAFGRPINIVVANPKGSAGKTPTALALAAAFGRARGGGVCALEVHELRGTMALRTLGQSGTVRDLLHDLSRLAPLLPSRGDIESYTRKQPSGLFEAMVSARAGQDQLTGQEFGQLQRVLHQFYSVVVIDTANNEAAPAWQAAMAAADALVVPVKWRRDVCLPAVEMLEDLHQTNPDLARRAVVVASHGVGEIDVPSRQQLMGYLSKMSGWMLDLPTDPHLASGGPIVWDQLTEPYRAAARLLGQTVAKSLPVRPPHFIPHHNR